MDDAIPKDVPFSLVCMQCDAGMEIGSFDEALAAGWHFIQYAPDLPMANFVGLCPDCRQQEDDASIEESQEA